MRTAQWVTKRYVLCGAVIVGLLLGLSSTGRVEDHSTKAPQGHRQQIPRRILNSDVSHTQHDKLGLQYQQAAARFVRDSQRNAALARRYSETLGSEPDAGLRRALGAYHLLVASHEIEAARVMITIAVTHLQLSESSRRLHEEEGIPSAESEKQAESSRKGRQLLPFSVHSRSINGELFWAFH